MSEQTMPDETPAETSPVEPNFKERVVEVIREVLPEFLKEASPGTSPDAPRETSRPRSLRQEESDFERAVEKVLGKLKASEPPAPAVKPEPVVETPPGPPPRKKRISTAIWGD